MTLSSYAEVSFYLEHYGKIPESEVEKRLYAASRHIDSLTFNRIVGIGFYNLTEFQQEIVQRVVCSQAEFEAENETLINSVLTSYSINGVSMGIDAGGWNITVQNGVVMRSDTYAMLQQTGLCCRRLGGRR